MLEKKSLPHQKSEACATPPAQQPLLHTESSQEKKHGKKRNKINFVPGVHLIMPAQKLPQRHRIHFKRYAHIQKYQIKRLFRYYGNYFTQTMVEKYFSGSAVSSEDLVTELLRLAIDDETFLSPDTVSIALSMKHEQRNPSFKSTSIVPREKLNEHFSPTASLG